MGTPLLILLCLAAFAQAVDLNLNLHLCKLLGLFCPPTPPPSSTPTLQNVECNLTSVYLNVIPLYNQSIILYNTGRSLLLTIQAALPNLTTDQVSNFTSQLTNLTNQLPPLFASLQTNTEALVAATTAANGLTLAANSTLSGQIANATFYVTQTVSYAGISCIWFYQSGNILQKQVISPGQVTALVTVNSTTAQAQVTLANVDLMLASILQQFATIEEKQGSVPDPGFVQNVTLITANVTAGNANITSLNSEATVIAKAETLLNNPIYISQLDAITLQLRVLVRSMTNYIVAAAVDLNSISPGMENANFTFNPANLFVFGQLLTQVALGNDVVANATQTIQATSLQLYNHGEDTSNLNSDLGLLQNSFMTLTQYAGRIPVNLLYNMFLPINTNCTNGTSSGGGGSGGSDGGVLLHLQAADLLNVTIGL